MKTPNDAPTEALVWYVGDLSLESDVRQTFLIVGKRFNLAIEVIVISDMESLSYHRPRAPSVAALLCLPLTSTWSRVPEGTTSYTHVGVAMGSSVADARPSTLHGPRQ